MGVIHILTLAEIIDWLGNNLIYRILFDNTFLKQIDQKMWVLASHVWGFLFNKAEKLICICFILFITLKKLTEYATLGLGK